MSVARVRGAALVGLWLGLGACSLSLDFSDECVSDGDCAAGLVCAQRLCVRGTAPADAGLEAGGRDASGPGGPPSLPAECARIHGVPPAEAWGSDTVRLGLLLPLSGALGAVGPPMERAALLAVDEINQSGGLAGARLALVVCDTGTDPAQAVRVARWLADTARVPAIVGPAASSSTLQVFTDVARASRTLIMSPSATSPALSDQQDDDLLWRTAPSDAIQGRAISAYLQAEGLARVAVVNRNDTYGNGLTEAVRSSLCAARPCGEETYFNRRYAEGAGAGELAGLFSQVRAFAPDALVLVAFVDDGVELVNLAALAGIDRLVLTDGTKDPALLAGANDPESLRLALGTAPAPPAGDGFQAFSQRYQSQWGAAPGVFNAQTYDAVYLLALAAGAQAAEGSLSGPELARQLRRLSAGPAVAAGPTDFNRGLSVLRGDPQARVDFSGASGALDFDANGEAPGDIEAWRFDLARGRIVSLGTLYTAAGVYQPVAAGPPDAGAPDAGPEGE